MMKRFLPHALSWKGVLWWVIGIIYFKLLYFDLLWALESTFSGFQFPIGYCTKLALATLLAAPLLLWRSRWYAGLVCVLLDVWLVANLMYFRTYFTVIPASSYLLVGNLAGFEDSVYESVRWADLGFLATTVLLLAELWKTNMRAVIGAACKKMARTMAWLFGVPAVVTGVFIAAKGGYKEAYDDLMYDFSTCGAAVYTIPGAMSYEWIRGKVELTPEVRAEITEWLDKRPGNGYTPPKYAKTPDNVVILLLESFESWPIGATVEGQELTPNINRMLATDTTAFYAPYTLTQAKGARSIDAQLLLHTGLVPVNYGAYSYRFVHNEYPSIDKAWKQKWGERGHALSMTVDKRTVWNVGVVAQDFGYELYDKPFFVNDLKTGPRGRLGDTSFFRQVYEKTADTAIWRPGEHHLMQCVTYSGHTPFMIPDSLKELKNLPKDFPERLRNYMQTVRYTDRAVGQFVTRLKADKRFDNTMIVIVGDHEGLGAERADYLRNKRVAQLVADDWYTPLIVLNGPVSGRYDKLLGQVDLYPTLLDMAGLWAYPWHGLGQSILDPSKKAVALHPLNKIKGDAQSLTPEETAHVRSLYNVGDLMITTNWFKQE